MTAEAEHVEGEECVGRFEPERYAGDKADLSVDRLSPAVGQSVLDRRQDRLGVRDDGFLQVDERRPGLLHLLISGRSTDLSGMPPYLMRSDEAAVDV